MPTDRTSLVYLVFKRVSGTVEDFNSDLDDQINNINLLI